MREIDPIKIDTEEDLAYLIKRVINGPTFAEAFKFISYDFRDQFLTSIGVKLDEYFEKYNYYDGDRKIHISESGKYDYIWISTMGLIAQRGRITIYDNKYLNSCNSQYIVLSLLLEKAKSLCEDETTYDVDSYKYGYLNELNNALYTNLIFYFEIFSKTYLSLSKEHVPKTHKLSELFIKVKETMFKLNHNDTIFHAYIISQFEQIVNHISTLPSSFRECNVKYDDNPDDLTVIVFNQEVLLDMERTFELGNDFIIDYYFSSQEEGKNTYLKQGLFIRLLEKCQSDDEKLKVLTAYRYLLEKDSF